LRGSRRTAFATVVASCESWGVKKLASNSGDITLPRREGKIFFVKKILGGGLIFYIKNQFLDFEFFKLEKDKTFNK